MGLLDKILKKKEEIETCKSCGVVLNKLEKKSTMKICFKCQQVIRNNGIADIQNQKNKDANIEDKFDLNDIKSIQRLVMFFVRYNYNAIEQNEESYFGNNFIVDLHYLYPKEYHIELVRNGYFVPPTMHDVLKKMTVKELKDLMKVNNIKASGNKDDLIEEIKKHISVSTAEKILKHEQYYVLSEGAQKFVDDYYDLLLLYANKDWGINIDVYHAYRTKLNSNDFYVIAYEALKGLRVEYQVKRKYTALKNNLIALMKVCERFKEFEEEVMLAIEVLLLDLNCLNQYEILINNKDKKLKKQFLEKPYPNAVTFINIDALNCLNKHAGYYVESYVDEAYKNLGLPYECFSSESMKQLIDELICEGIIDYDKYMKMAYDQFKIFVKKKL